MAHDDDSGVVSSVSAFLMMSRAARGGVRKFNDSGVPVRKEEGLELFREVKVGDI